MSIINIFNEIELYAIFMLIGLSPIIWVGTILYLLEKHYNDEPKQFKKV